jgi:hypothetical protein
MRSSREKRRPTPPLDNALKNPPDLIAEAAMAAPKKAMESARLLDGAFPHRRSAGGMVMRDEKLVR